MLAQKTIDIIKFTVPVLEVHGVEITTVFYKNLFNEHPELLNIFNHANQNQGRQQTALANAVLAAAQYIDRLEVISPVVRQIAEKHRSLGVKPEHYPIVGEHLLRAIEEVLSAAATEEIINAWADAYGVISSVFINIEKELYEQAALQTNGWSDFKPFKVIDKVKESEVITSFYLAPADQSAVPVFESGQYITVRLQIPGEPYLVNRQYSLSAAPNKEYFRISVKREAEPNKPEGKVSNYLHDHIHNGDVIEMTAPAGEFTLKGASSAPVVFISGGVGITPFISMVNSIADHEPTRYVTFIHASKNGEQQAFKEELLELAERMTNYHLSFIYENPSETDRLNKHFKKEGYINTEWLKENAVVDSAEYYLCGPVPFLQAILRGLKELGIHEEQIHYEFFGPSMKLDI
ncbi:flavohemoprotein [Robertmurraya siralis]|uniref:Flavohemoprotein n=1 Tax=Robertmurraya siralis TaxID=77777 RepID=A0A919WJM4_9BACI|nr:NO-inducible flavohemoprotein [Robertmurraya siralis]GIN63266.1 flavohemoprotein [Robertmurraya siralis]